LRTSEGDSKLIKPLPHRDRLFLLRTAQKASIGAPQKQTGTKNTISFPSASSK